jgi:L-malate glycosyltransferase
MATGILFVAHDTGFIGGAERQILELFKGIHRQEFRPVLVCLEPGGPVARRTAEMNILVHTISRKWRWDLGVVWKLRGLIRREDISIVHAYLGLPGFYGALAGKAAGARVISTIRIAGPRKRFSDVSERLAFLLSDCIISNSKAGADYYFKNFPGRRKTRIIYNGYVMTDFDQAVRRTRAELGLPDRAALIGHVANLSFLKDYPTFLRALAVVFRENKGAEAVIVGDGNRRPAYEALARQLGISDRTHFLGARSDVLDLVKHFDVCVLASHGEYSEGLSNSVAEYMGLGKPVVAAAIGGNLELVKDGVTGFLTPPGEPAPMAQKILTLLSRPDLARTMGTEGRKFFQETFGLDKMVAETEKVYAELLRK